MELKEMSFEKSKSKVREWRMRYSSLEYPKKVVMNLFYQLKPTEIMWKEIGSIFNQKAIFQNFSDAFYHILNSHRNVQIQMQPTFDEDLVINPVIGDIDYNNFLQKVSAAAAGDSKMVEEIEYCYIWFSLRDTLMLAFLACGLTGMTISQAYEKVCGFCSNNAVFSSYNFSVEAFNPEVSLFMQRRYVSFFT